MRIPKLKLIFGILIVWGSSLFPKQVVVDLLHTIFSDSSAFGVDFISPLVQLGIILIGAIGISMIKGVLLRSDNNRSRYR